MQSKNRADCPTRVRSASAERQSRAAEHHPGEGLDDAAGSDVLVSFVFDKREVRGERLCKVRR
jgi:hypothetical protein